MFNEKAYGLGANRSVIRELFEYGRKRTAEVGPENVFDFSLGNPSIPAPPQVEAAHPGGPGHHAQPGPPRLHHRCRRRGRPAGPLPTT